jgi:hypothetical protein
MNAAGFPARLNLDAVVDKSTRPELQQLAERVEAVIQDLAPVLEQCYRALLKVDDVTQRLASGMTPGRSSTRTGEPSACPTSYTCCRHTSTVPVARMSTTPPASSGS